MIDLRMLKSGANRDCITIARMEPQRVVMKQLKAEGFHDSKTETGPCVDSTYRG